MSNQKIIEVFALCHELGLQTSAYNMIGFPFETAEMIEETLNLNKKISPDFVQISIFYPYPGTELWQQCKEQGLLSDKHKDSYFDQGSTLNLPTLTESQINEYYEQFKDLAFEKAVKRSKASSLAFNIAKIICGNSTRRARKLINKVRGAK